MLYAIARELGDALKAQGVPFPVVFALGREPTDSIGTARERIVFEQKLDQKSDQIVPIVGVHKNARMPFVRQQAATIRIFARSSASGAKSNEHAERAEQVLDHVLAELNEIVRARRNALACGASGFVSLADEKGASAYSGAIYELDITIDRGVYRTTWAGDKRPEATFGPGGVGIRSTTKVSLGGGDAPETACGG